MKNKVQKTVQANALFTSGERVTVALSGGADSVCLLHILHEYVKDYNLTLEAVHVNHHLRGAESQRDENFCRKLCENLSVKLTTFSVDVMDEAEKSGDSIEVCARRLRYDCFETVGGIIATAHNADDHAETMLINLIRGTALKGLCGILPKRDRYVRPLIDCTAEEIRAYCHEQGWAYVTDSTNLSDDYTRNRLRHHVLPLLKDENPRLVEAWRDTARALNADEAYLNQAACDAFATTKTPDGLSVDLLKDLPQALRLRVLALWMRENGEEVSRVKLDALESLLCTPNGQIMLSKHVIVYHTGGQLTTTPPLVVDVVEQQAVFDRFIPFCGEKQVLLTVEPLSSKNVHQNDLKKYMDYDKIEHTVYVRARREGDSIALAHNPMTKTLKKLYNEKKIPLTERQTRVVLADKQGVFWVEGFGLDRRVAADEQTRRILRITVV